MSNLSSTPLRVAELSSSDQDYAPNDSVRSNAPFFVNQKTTVPTSGERNTQYAWNPTANTQGEMLTEMEQRAATAEHVELAKSFDELCDVLEKQPPSLVAPQRPQQPPTSHVWGIDYHAVNMEQTLDYLEQVIQAKKPAYAITANLNYAMLCKKHPRLDTFTKKATLVLCDGMPAVWRSKLEAIKIPERVAGADLIYRLSERCANRRFRVYLYGAAEGVAERAAVKLKERYPDLIIAGVQCPPFHDTSNEQIQNQIAKIRLSKPDVLFVALGQPKGEYWIEDHLKELNVPLSIQLGASFDFVAGNSTRAPKLIQKVGLEWLYRTIRDPKRLGPRYFQNLLFLLKALRRDLLDRLS